MESGIFPLAISDREVGLSGIFNLAAREHLADDYFDVFFERSKTRRELVHLADFANDVFLYHFLTSELEYFSNVGRTIGKKLALFNFLAYFHYRHTAERHCIFHLILIAFFP